MMDKKRIRETLNDAVERYLLGDVDGDFRFNYIWLTAQLFQSTRLSRASTAKLSKPTPHPP